MWDNLQIVEIQKGLSQGYEIGGIANLQIVEIQKGLSQQHKIGIKR